MRARRPELFPLCELPENKMVRASTRLYPGRHPSDVIEYLRMGERMTLAQIARHLGVGMRTVCDWSPSICYGVQNHGPDEREKLRRRMVEYNRTRRYRKRGKRAEG